MKGLEVRKEDRWSLSTLAVGALAAVFALVLFYATLWVAVRLTWVAYRVVQHAWG